MKTNFEIADNYALTFEGRHVDLHNNFKLVECNYLPTLQSLTFIWAKSDEEWVNADELNGFMLVHSNVNFVSIDRIHEDDQISHGNYLIDITFFPSSEREINNSLIPKANADKKDDILYQFESGVFIRVGCTKVEFVIK